MILAFTKTMHSLIIGQSRIKSNAQQKRAEGFTYSFTTNVGQADFNWNEIQDICNLCFQDVFRIADADFIKDVEISLDLDSDKYSLRFTSSRELSNEAYATHVTWLVQHCNGDYYIAEEKPLQSITDKRYSVTIEIEPISLDELSEIIED